MEDFEVSWSSKSVKNVLPVKFVAVLELVIEISSASFSSTVFSLSTAMLRMFSSIFERDSNIGKLNLFS